MKGYDAFAGVVKSGGKTRRAAKMVILDAGHPDVIDFIDSKLNEEKKAWALIEAGYDPSFTGEAYGSVYFQNANHSVRVTDEFMQAVVDDKDWTDPHRRRRQPMRHLQGQGHLPQDGGGRPRLRRPGHPVRHDDQRLAHVREHGSDLRVQPVLRVHVPQRHRLQPGEPQPDEVRRGGRRVRRRELSLRGEADDHRPGDPRRQRVLPDAADRGEQPQVPPARARLREPRRAADVTRPRLRQRRGPELRRRADRDHARRGLQAVEHRRPRPRRSVLGLRREPRAVPAGHQQAPRRGLRDPGGPGRPGRHDQGRPRGLRRGARARRESTATGTPRSPSSPRPARSPS